MDTNVKLKTSGLPFSADSPTPPDTHPAQVALALIGEPAIPELLEVIKTSPNTQVTAKATEALMWIKGDRQKYREFVEQQRGKMPYAKWRSLTAVIAD